MNSKELKPLDSRVIKEIRRLGGKFLLENIISEKEQGIQKITIMESFIHFPNDLFLSVRRIIPPEELKHFYNESEWFVDVIDKFGNFVFSTFETDDYPLMCTSDQIISISRNYSRKPIGYYAVEIPETITENDWYKVKEMVEKYGDEIDMAEIYTTEQEGNKEKEEVLNLLSRYGIFNQIFSYDFTINKTFKINWYYESKRESF